MRAVRDRAVHGTGRAFGRATLAALAGAMAIACGDEVEELHLVGTVERTLIELVAPISETIVAVEATPGEHIEPGQLVVQLDATFARAEVARAEANLAGARTGELVAAQELERAKQLRRDRVLSEQAFDRARLSRDEAGARLREAEALVAAAHKREADLSLVSPVDGVLDQLPFDRGERVPAGAVVAVVLSDGDPWVRVWVPEGSYVRVLPNTPAEIRIDGLDEPLHGRVLDVAREAEFTPHYALTERDRVHLVYETRIRIEDAPEGLRPGVPAAVIILAPDFVASARP